MLNIKPLALFITIILPFFAAAQTREFSWEECRTIITRFHPAAQRASMISDQANANLLMARGGFDLKTYGNFEQKQFNGKTYFSLLETGVKLPTYGGVELKTGYQYANGVYLNPESYLPKAGQAHAGINWTVGQGLLTDERRTNLKIAKAGVQLGEAERQLAMSKIVLEGAKSYWEWAYTWSEVDILNNTLQQSVNRHNALKESFLQGEKSAIDTLESYIQVQNRLTDLNFAQTDLQNAALALITFLWQEDGTPYNTMADFKAPSMFSSMLNSGDDAGNNPENVLPVHPEMVYYKTKSLQLQYENRLKKEKLKPVLDLSYNILGSGWQFFPTPTEKGPGVFTSDIKWGVQFSMPVPNRKARGDFQAAKIKLAQNNLIIQQKNLEIGNNIKSIINEINTLATQVSFYRDITGNYKKLLDAELEKYNAGETSVFMLNTREQKWLEAQLKQVKLAAEYQKKIATLKWASGKW